MVDILDGFALLQLFGSLIPSDHQLFDLLNKGVLDGSLRLIGDDELADADGDA